MKKFNDLESLRRERFRLEQQCKEKEARITDSLQYIQDNFGSLVLTSLLPFGKSKNEVIGGFLGKMSHIIARVFPNDEGKLSGRIQPVLKIVQMILAGLVYRYVRKFFSK